MDGVLNIDKPSGMTSHDVVAKVRKALRIKKVGHAGTLDPMATGVLLVLVGHATRIADLLMQGEKEYRATCALGATTTTEDSSGDITSTTDASQVSKEALLSILPKFRGEIQQIPPMVSAVHHEGQRLYELARKGQEVHREPRQVTIYSLDLLDFRPGESALANLNIVCSRGTYIRTICADIGRELGVGGHMSALARTRVGSFTLENAVSLDEVLTGEASFVSMDEALPDLPAVVLDESSANAVLNGSRVPLLEPICAELVKLHDPSGKLIALARVEQDALQPTKVFVGH